MPLKLIPAVSAILSLRIEFKVSKVSRALDNGRRRAPRRLLTQLLALLPVGDLKSPGRVDAQKRFALARDVSRNARFEDVAF